MTKDFHSLLTQYLDKKYLVANQVEQFANYLALMAKWNKTYNLTAITDPKEMVLRHISDSLAINDFLEGDRIIDVGTGAGLPGIPLAIVNPEKKFVLLDSNSKKTRFLTQVIAELCIENVDIVRERAENYRNSVCFDCVISRAFASMDKMLTLTQHLCCQNGYFLAMKGPDYIEELANIPKTFTVKWAKSLAVLGLNAKRYLVCIERI